MSQAQVTTPQGKCAISLQKCPHLAGARRKFTAHSTPPLPPTTQPHPTHTSSMDPITPRCSDPPSITIWLHFQKLCRTVTLTLFWPIKFLVLCCLACNRNKQSGFDGSWFYFWTSCLTDVGFPVGTFQHYTHFIPGKMLSTGCAEFNQTKKKLSSMTKSELKKTSVCGSGINQQPCVTGCDQRRLCPPARAYIYGPVDSSV